MWQGGRAWQASSSPPPPNGSKQGILGRQTSPTSRLRLPFGHMRPAPGPVPPMQKTPVLPRCAHKKHSSRIKRKGAAQGGRARERTHSGRSASTERLNRLPTPCFFLSRHGGHLGGSQCPLRLDPTVSSPFAEILPPWLLTSSNPLVVVPVPVPVMEELP